MYVKIPGDKHPQYWIDETSVRRMERALHVREAYPVYFNAVAHENGENGKHPVYRLVERPLTRKESFGTGLFAGSVRNGLFVSCQRSVVLGTCGGWCR